VAQLPTQDFVKPYAPSFHPDTGGDIARHAQRALAGIPIGIGQAGHRRQLIANLRLVAAAPMRAVGLLPILWNLAASPLGALRRHGVPVLRLRPVAISGNTGVKIGAALAVAALGLAVGLIYSSGRFARSLPRSDDGAPVAQTQAAGAEQFLEDRPLRD